MDDLNDVPEKVAEDIIKQATEGLGFRQTATDRIIDILISYHKLQKVISEFQMQQESETIDIPYDGDFAWKTSKGQKDGPFCAKCHSIGNGDIRLIDKTNGMWRCGKCNGTYFDSTFKEPDDDDSGHYSSLGGRR